MILHFKGYGLLVPFLFLGCFVLTEMVALVTTGGTAEWGLGAALISAGVICWFLGGWLKRRGSLFQNLRPSRQVDPEYCLRSFYWIKMEWWGPIFVALGLLFLIPGQTRLSGGLSGPASRQISESRGNKTRIEGPGSEPGGAENRSQPVGSGTNQVSAAAGSRR
jgi:hypothetical protein